MKINFKKYIGLLIVTIISIPTMVYGQQPAGSGTTPSPTPAGSGTTPTSGGGGFTFPNPISGSPSLPQLVNNIFDAIIQIGLVFIVMAIIYSGLKFVLAQGDKDALKEAKRIFLYTVIGGVILLGAGAIAEVVCNTANQFLTNQISC